MRLQRLRWFMQLCVLGFLALVLVSTVSMAASSPVKTIIFPVQDIARTLPQKYGIPWERDSRYPFYLDSYEVKANRYIANMERNSELVEYIPQAKLAAITDKTVHKWYLSQLKVPGDPTQQFNDTTKIRPIVRRITGATVFVSPTICVVVDEKKTPTMVSLNYWIADSIPGSIDEHFNMVSKIDCPLDEMMSDLIKRFLVELPGQIDEKLKTSQQQKAPTK